MNIIEDFVGIMCQVNPKYKQHVRYENRKEDFYLLFLRAIYDCIEHALLWYKILPTTLEGIGFDINPYYICDANKMIGGKQCPIYWYVDGNTSSHKNPAVISIIINKMNKYFGYLSVVRGIKHTFLGMKIDIKDNRIQIDMVKQSE